MLSTLDAYNFGLSRDKNAGPKTMEYLSFWLIYILIDVTVHIWNKRQQFKDSRHSNIMKSSNAQAWNTEQILLNNLGSKRSVVMKSGQFMQYYKIIFLSKNSTKNVAWKLVPGPF